MPFDPRPYREVIRALTTNRPLGTDERQQYVDRPDRLGRKILNRVLEDTGRPLLLAGPPGCGKSTELIWLPQQDMSFRCVLCPCDRDLDLNRITVEELYRYLMWRVLEAVPELSEEIKCEAWGWVGSDTRSVPRPRTYFADRPVVFSTSLGSKANPATIRDTMGRLLSEARRYQPLLLLVDGLEKVPPDRKNLLLNFLHEQLWEDTAIVIVIPLYLLYGSEAGQLTERADVLSVEFKDENDWMQKVIEQRTNGLLSQDLIDRLVFFSGGVVRDGLQLTRMAFRSAIDNERDIHLVDVSFATNELENYYWAILSNRTEDARRFLIDVHKTNRLPGDQALRDIMLSQGIVLTSRPGSYIVHPLLLFRMESKIQSAGNKAA